MRFPTGGRVRERMAQNRCDSDTDSIVWMEEDSGILLCFCALSLSRGAFFGGEIMEARKHNVRKITMMAMLSAVAYVLAMVARFQLIPAAPFLTYEPKDTVIAIGGFLFGPVEALVISLVVSLLEIPVSGTSWIGCVMNVLSTCAFACTAAWVYKKRHNLSGAVIGLVLGSAIMVVVMLLWNWLITPMYMGAPRSAVVSMLVPVFLPFNALKAGLNTAFVLGLYKPLTNALRKARLLPPAQQSRGKNSVGVYLFAAVLLISCILIAMAI